MSGKVIKIRPGEPMFIWARLYNDDATKIIRTEIRSPAGPVFGSVQLTHLADGFYADSSFPMPNENLVYADHHIFESDGVTRSVNTWQAATDIYQLDSSQLSLRSLSGKISSSNMIDARLAESRVLDGRVVDEQVSGSSEASTGAGEVS